MARANDETVAGAPAPGSIVRISDEVVRPEAETIAGPLGAASASPSPSPPPPPLQGSPLPEGHPGDAVLTAKPGARVGDYVLCEFLADGGFGVVYRARHAASGAPAAVKILHAELASSPDVILRFEREVEAIRRVKHPNVIEVYGCGRLDDGRPYFAMELLKGMSLEEHLRARGRLPAGEVRAILTPLCDALAAAHERSIVHRDIKGSNVFLCENEGTRRVVLLDFGVAKLLDVQGPALTSSRHIVGTFSCMAPEQLLGRAVDARTDVYALGVLTYWMLTGEHPFADSSFPVLQQMHLHARPPRPSSRARVAPAFDDPVLQAMSKDPAARPATVGAFLEGIRAAAELSRAPLTPALSSGVRERRALGVHIEVEVDASAMDDGDEHLLSDMEAILPLSASELSSAGFAVVVETGTSMLLVLRRPEDLALDEAARRGSVDAVINLYRKLEARDERDERVRVAICIHAGSLLASEEGTLVGGDLLELASWVPEVSAPGVFASKAALAGLEMEAQPAGEGGVARGSEFARVDT